MNLVCRNSPSGPQTPASGKAEIDHMAGVLILRRLSGTAN